MKPSQNEIKTYTLGLHQAKSFRFLKQKGNSLLAKHGLNTTEWAILGIILENKTTTKTELSNILHFKKPFLTRIISELLEKKLIVETKDKQDKRSELLTLSEYGRNFVLKTEVEISFFYGLFLSMFEPKELDSYLSFIRKISDMSDADSAKKDNNLDVYNN